MEAVADFIFLGFRVTEHADCSHEIKTLAPWKKSYDKPRQCVKKQRHHFANKGLHNQSYGLIMQTFVGKGLHNQSYGFLVVT